jgi:hypothetical protein
MSYARVLRLLCDCGATFGPTTIYSAATAAHAMQAAERRGWRACAASSTWLACSDDCAARLARDVTPARPAVRAAQTRPLASWAAEAARAGQATFEPHRGGFKRWEADREQPGNAQRAKLREGRHA